MAIIIAANVIGYIANDNGLLGLFTWKRRGRSSFFASATRNGPGWRHTKPNQYWAFDVLDPVSTVSLTAALLGSDA